MTRGLSRAIAGKGPRIGEAKDKLDTAIYQARVAEPLGIAAGGD